MKIRGWIRKLYLAGVISRSPAPALPFILSFLILFFAYILPSGFDFWEKGLFWLSLFSFIFGLLHWFVVCELRKSGIK
jgi:hypothetical protein